MCVYLFTLYNLITRIYIFINKNKCIIRPMHLIGLRILIVVLYIIICTCYIHIYTHTHMQIYIYIYIYIYTHTHTYADILYLYTHMYIYIICVYVCVLYSKHNFIHLNFLQLIDVISCIDIGNAVGPIAKSKVFSVPPKLAYLSPSFPTVHMAISIEGIKKAIYFYLM